MSHDFSFCKSLTGEMLFHYNETNVTQSVKVLNNQYFIIFLLIIIKQLASNH